MEFTVTGKTGRKAVFAELARHFRVRPGTPCRVSRTLFDTFDWRLYAAGQRIEEVREGGSLTTRWIESATNRTLGFVEGPAGTLARDWQPSALGAALARTIKMRALLPVANFETAWWPADILDEREKTVLRVAFEVNRVRSAGRQSGAAVTAGILLSPVRGYQKACSLAADILSCMPGIARAEHGMLERVLSAAGRSPRDYSSKINLSIEPDMPAEAAVRSVLARLLDIIDANHYGTAAAIDTEFLHDFRVAVRRTRSMLGQMKVAIPRWILSRFRPEFAWLGAVTGPTRDLDVYSLKFDDYTAALDESTRADLVPLAGHIAGRQREEQRTLARAITSARYYRLIDGWRKALSRTWRQESDTFKGHEPIQAVAGRRILKLFTRALQQGSALSEDTPASAVHELRITCKKLRYMLEFFENLYPADEAGAFTGALKKLQDMLGDFQDYEVHRAELYAFGEEMAQCRAGGTRTLLAMGRLAEGLTESQGAVRDQLGRSFSAFAARCDPRRVRTLFADSNRNTDDENSGSI